MSVKLDPTTQLSFHRPFHNLVKEILVVSNPNNEPVAFKVKTTSPKQYCVRPNSGRIEPNQSVEVQVLLQPMEKDPPDDFVCKDKFMVQSVSITPERETLTLQELWKVTEEQAKNTIKEKKIRCVYLPPVGSDLPPASPPPNLPLPPQPPVSAVPTQSSPLGNSIYSDSRKNELPSPPPYNPSDTISTPEKNSSGRADRSILTSANNLNGHIGTIIGAFPKDDTGNESYSAHDSLKDENNPARLRRQLLEAQEEISRMNHTIENYKQELETAKMRQRKNEESASSVNRHSVSGIGGYSVKTQEKIPEGYYPFEVVVGAAVGAFLFGVMFF